MSGDDRDERGLTADPDADGSGHTWPGVAALALFAVMAWVFLGAEFGEAAGFPDGASITASIGYAMFNIQTQNAVPSEGFLVPFEIIDLLLVAALVGAVMLARREEDGEVTSALRSGAAEDSSSSESVVADGGGERTADRGRDGSEEQGGEQ